jgi:hypothetical protein
MRKCDQTILCRCSREVELVEVQDMLALYKPHWVFLAGLCECGAYITMTMVNPNVPKE